LPAASGDARALAHSSLGPADGTAGVIRMLSTIAHWAGESVDVATLVGRVVAETIRVADWQVGQGYVIDHDGTVMLTSTAARLPNPDPAALRALGSAGTTSDGRPAAGSLPHRVLSRRGPVWIADLAADRTFVRSAAAAGIGVGSALAFPVLLAGRVVAILEFFGRGIAQPDELLVEVIAGIGSQIGRVAE